MDIEQCVGSQKVKRDKQSQSDATDNEKENQNGQGKELIDNFVGRRTKLHWQVQHMTINHTGKVTLFL